MASPVSVRLKVVEAQRPDQEVIALEDWVRRARLKGVRTRRESEPIQPGQMGPELLPILTVALSSTVLAELARAVGAWVSSRRRRVTLEIEIDGRKVRIESEGTETAETILRQLEPLLAAGSRA